LNLTNKTSPRIFSDQIKRIDKVDFERFRRYESLREPSKNGAKAKEYKGQRLRSQWFNNTEDKFIQ
jgi:hypothetical protein